MNGASQHLFLQRRKVDLLVGHVERSPFRLVRGDDGGHDDGRALKRTGCLQHRGLAFELFFSSQTKPIIAMIMTEKPRTVSIHVPVEPSPPNVQNSAMSSLHSSNGNASNIV